MLRRRLIPLLAALTLISCSQSKPAEFDIVIRGGTLYSGADRRPEVTDIGIVGDRITALGNLENAIASTRIDARGLAVAPGFIDIHSHALRENKKRSGIHLWPDAENLIRQGVTTVIGGPDGGSPLPIADDLAYLEQNPASVNFGTFVGQGSIRELIVGEVDRPATADEMQAMRAEVDKAMHDGAFGLSSGLIYAPGSFADTEEVIELARIAALHGGIYISHMRDEALGLLDSVQETIRIGEEAGLPAQITHFKAMGKPMWGKSGDAIALIDAAIARGVDVSIDQYPYAASSTGLSAVFPQWSLSGDVETRRERLRDPETRARVKADMIVKLRQERGGDDPERVQLAYCGWDESLNGKTVRDLLEEKNLETSVENAADVIMDLQLAGGCSAVYHAMSDQDVERIMRHPATMVSSDGGIEAPGPAVPHPRNYGSFARVLGLYVREQGVLPLHRAIHKMSMLPADRLGLVERGRIEVGAIADIAIFDPDTIIDKAVFAEPHQYAEGVHHVIVGGEVVLLDAVMTGKRPGRVLRFQGTAKP